MEYAFRISCIWVVYVTNIPTSAISKHLKNQDGSNNKECEKYTFW